MVRGLETGLLLMASVLSIRALLCAGLVVWGGWGCLGGDLRVAFSGWFWHTGLVARDRVAIPE